MTAATPWSVHPEIAGPEPPARVLVVDDEEAIVRSLLRELRGQPYVVTGINEPLKALAAIRETHYALVISDQRMPEMTGLELLEQVRLIAPDTIRLMLTGNLDLETAIKSINRGDIYRFITKPWDRVELLKHIEDGLTQQRLARHNRGLREQLREMESVLGPISTQLKQIALKDPLTGLYNLSELHAQIDRQIVFFDRDKQPFCLVLCAMDRVPGLDDGDDYLARDHLLQAVAAVIASTIRNEVDAAFRLGGRRFALLLRAAPEGGAQIACRRLAGNLEKKPVLIADNSYSVTLCHGVAEYQAGWGREMLIGKAELALQAATISGKAQTRLWSALI